MSHDDPLISKTEQRVPKPDAESRTSLADGDQPLPGRRQFLGTGLAAGAASVIGMPASLADGPGNLPPHVPGWTRRLGPGVASHPYGSPSPFEQGIARRTLEWLRPRPESSVSFTPLHGLHGIITPSGLVFERHHAGIPAIDPHDHRLIIHGKVERALKFTVQDLMRFPAVSRVHFLECAANGVLEWRGAQLNALQFTHGMLSCCEWTGVPLATLLHEAGLRNGASWILAEGADAAALARSFPVHKALDDALVVYAQNGEMLRPEQGYPLRLLLPGWEGIANVKWLRRLEVGDRPWAMREETAAYTDLMPDGKARQFTFVQEAKSVITWPCPERPVTERGQQIIKGFAWSGRGRVRNVDVSVDGGRNWQRARIVGPVYAKALTRFEIPWQWRGESALLQSRVVDDSGYVQPTLKQLRAVRGTRSIYHNNAIQTWQVLMSGAVENVQLS